MSKYAALDDKIVKAIADGHNKFFRLECMTLSLGMAPGNLNLLERRLQALRKAGRIEFADRHWRVTQS